MVVVYGLPHCDTVKSARAWLAEQRVVYKFHDLSKLGVRPDRLDLWLSQCSWERLVNRQGTTWRNLAPASQAWVNDGARAKALMLAQPSVIKRPVVEWGDQITVGFDPDSWSLLARR